MDVNCDALYQAFTALNVFGRVYLAREGINAQISVPESNVSAFRELLYGFDPALNGLRLNIALDDDGKSFWVLRMKVRERIVADGIDDPSFNASDVGDYLKAAEVNAMLDDPDAVFIDMRNHYEYEVGHFENAMEIPADTFREQLPKAVEMMQEQTLEGAPREKALHTMREQTSRMEGLVRQLLTLSKIEAAPTHGANEVIDVPMMLRVVEREAQTLSQQKQSFSFEVDTQLKVLGSEEQLRSAISNLVYNAVNHTPAGTHIIVRWQPVAHGAEFSVEDNGPGIAAEHIPRLTERFYRVDKARSRQTGGSGLGLAIVKHAVNHHDSRLDISSTPGKGTRFSFVLPERLIAKNAHA